MSPIGSSKPPLPQSVGQVPLESGTRQETKLQLSFLANEGVVSASLPSYPQTALGSSLSGLMGAGLKSQAELSKVFSEDKASVDNAVSKEFVS